MAPSTWTSADLTRIERAIRSGALRVSYGDGKSVSYRSLDEMFAIRNQIAASLGLNRGPIRRVAASSKGIRPGSIDRRDRNWP
jgi:hypothetical protein